MGIVGDNYVILVSMPCRLTNISPYSHACKTKEDLTWPYVEKKQLKRQLLEKQLAEKLQEKQLAEKLLEKQLAKKLQEKQLAEKLQKEKLQKEKQLAEKLLEEKLLAEKLLLKQLNRSIPGGRLSNYASSA